MKITSLIENTAGAEGCVPLHGLSLYIETERHRVLMDFGPSDDTLRNAERLGVDLRGVEEIANRLMELPCRFCTCHCTGIEPFERMKAILGERLSYLRTGESIAIG